MATTTSDASADGDGVSRFIVVTAALAALNGLLFGFDTGVVSGALLYVHSTFLVTTAFHSMGLGTDVVKEFIVSGTLVGAILGAAFGGRLADRLGRRRTILVGASVFFLGSLDMALSPDVYWLIVGRLVVGLAIGVASVVGPLYISEIAPPRLRGSLVSFNQLAVTVGILCAYFVNYAFSGSGAWRWMFGFGMLPAAVLALGMYAMPESPRWLFENDMTGRAKDVLRRSREDEQVEAEIAEIRETQQGEGVGVTELLKPWIRPALVVGVFLAVFQQITGINTVIYYAPTILNHTGLSASASIVATVGVGVVNVAMTIVSILLIDRLGRRKLLLGGLGGMVVMLAVLGGVFAVGLGGALGWVAAVCLMLFVGSFAVGFGPVFWLLISEIYPQNVRGSAMGVASLCNWAANLVMGLSFLSFVNAVGQRYAFWTLGVLSVVALVFSYRLVPETKGRTLEDIETDLRERYLTRDADEYDAADHGVRDD